MAVMALTQEEKNAAAVVTVVTNIDRAECLIVIWTRRSVVKLQFSAFVHCHILLRIKASSAPMPKDMQPIK